MGKLRMVKAMTGRAIPRIRLLKAMYVQTKKTTRRKNDLRVSSWPPRPVTR